MLRNGIPEKLFISLKEIKLRKINELQLSNILSNLLTEDISKLLKSKDINEEQLLNMLLISFIPFVLKLSKCNEIKE